MGTWAEPMPGLYKEAELPTRGADDLRTCARMVACAATAVTSQIVLLAEPPMTSSVDLLKQQLLQAVDNSSVDDARTVLGELERAIITKEILETTRIGASVNEIRKGIADKWPDVSKRCRGLIKAWQKLVEVRPASSCTSSANGTPNLVSPAAAKLARRGLTPSTPVNRRVTSTGLSNGSGRSSTVSPAAGYAPKPLDSPTANGGALHKSMSVGNDLLSRGDENRNGKRRLEESNVSSPAMAIKRTKTAVGALSTQANQTNTSVSAARQAVQSTSELIAQLSQNLPEHMCVTMSATIKQHEEKVKREQLDEELAQSLHGAVASPYSHPERKKRKYERKIKQEPTPEAEEDRRGGLIIRLPRLAPVKEERIVDEPTTRPEVRKEAVVPPAQAPSRPPSTSIPRIVHEQDTEEDKSSSPPRKQIDWMAQLPSIEQLRIRADEEKAKPATQPEDPLQLFLKRQKDREVLILPYLNMPTVPDFIRYRYPNPERFYVEQNYRRRAV